MYSDMFWLSVMPRFHMCSLLVQSKLLMSREMLPNEYIGQISKLGFLYDKTSTTFMYCHKKSENQTSHVYLSSFINALKLRFDNLQFFFFTLNIFIRNSKL